MFSLQNPYKGTTNNLHVQIKNEKSPQMDDFSLKSQITLA